MYKTHTQYISHSRATYMHVHSIRHTRPRSCVQMVKTIFTKLHAISNHCHRETAHNNFPMLDSHTHKHTDSHRHPLSNIYPHETHPRAFFSRSHSNAAIHNNLTLCPHDYIASAAAVSHSLYPAHSHPGATLADHKGLERMRKNERQYDKVLQRIR